MTDSRRRDLFAIAILIAIPTLLFIDIFLGSGVFYSGDVTFYHLPGKKILHDIVLGGEFPYWNPFISAGQPLAANPANEVFYPLTWLILLPDFLYGFQLLAISHVYIAIFTMYALLRSLGTTRAAAIVGGLSFGLGGFVLSALQLFPFLFSAAWMPLVCLFTRRFLRERAPRDFALAVGALSMQLLIGEPVTVLQTGFVLGMYALFRGERQLMPRLRDVSFVGAISIAALGLSAVQTVPMLDHYRDSVRSKGFEFSLVSDWSTPPARFLEMIYPSIMGTARVDSPAPYWGTTFYGKRGGPFFSSIYSGLLIPLMALAGVLAGTRGRWLYVSICAASVVLALGSHTPLLSWLYELGWARSIRYPEKFIIMGVFATIVFGALALDTLLRGDALVRKIAIAIAATTTLLAGIAAALTYAPSAADDFRSLWQIEPRISISDSLSASRVGWFVAAGRGLLLAGLLFLVQRARRTIAVGLVGMFVVTDLSMFVSTVAPRTERAFYTEPPPVVRELDPDHSAYRIFQINDATPRARNRQGYMIRRPHALLLLRNALGGYSLATYGIHVVMETDYDLTGLKGTEDFMRAAWELSRKTPDWLNYVAVMSNIRYVGVYNPLKPEAERAHNDVRYIRPVRFLKGRSNPRYYFASQVVFAPSHAEFVKSVASGRYSKQTAFVDGPPFAPAPGQVLGWSETANTARIDVVSAGRSFLVMSVTAHKYWTVTIDNVVVPSITTNRGYQGVYIPAGRHVVAMRYRNPLIATGGVLSTMTLLALLLVSRRKNHA